MRDITIIELTESPGVAVFYKPELVATMGLDTQMIAECKKSGQLSVIIPPIINDMLMPLLITQEGSEYADWLPVALLFGQMPTGGILPILQLVHDPTELINRENCRTMGEDRTLHQYVEQYISDYMMEQSRQIETPKQTNDAIHYIFVFDTFSHALKACDIISFDNCNKKQIWKCQDKYYMIISCEEKTAISIAICMADYNGTDCPSNRLMYITEHGECIVQDIIKMQKALT